jgi:hypothetical protein
VIQGNLLIGDNRRILVEGPDQQSVAIDQQSVAIDQQSVAIDQNRGGTIERRISDE